MKKNTKIIYISEVILTVYAILLTLFINNISYDVRNFSAVVVLLLVLVILLAFFGYKKDKSYLKGSSARIVMASLMTFMLIIYGIFDDIYVDYLWPWNRIRIFTGICISQHI